MGFRPGTIVMLAGIVIPGVTSVSGRQTVVERNGQLRVENGRIVNAAGQSVAFRGMSLFWSQWIDKYYNGDCVKWLKDDWNISIIRAAMAVEHGGYLENPDREKNRVTEVVQAAIDQGIYVIIDWHDHNAHEHAAEAQAFFEEMAQRFGEHPNVIYEPYNEPERASWSSDIKPYHEGVIERIRRHDPDNIVVAGTRNWSQEVEEASLNPIDDDNVAYTLHFYAGSHGDNLRNKAARALANGAALMITEWGTSHASGDLYINLENSRKWLDFADQNQLSWCNWSVADKDEESAALKPGADARGGWTEDKLTPSGTFVRQEIRLKGATVKTIGRRPELRRRPANGGPVFLPGRSGKLLFLWGGEAGAPDFFDAGGRQAPPLPLE